MTDIYQPYRDMLLGKDVPVHSDEPYPGRYKLKGTDGRFLPVAIGPDQFGNLTALVDGLPRNPVAIWMFCAKNPVTQDAYKFRKENGRWPDEPEPVVRSNMPSDPFDALLAEIESMSAQAENLLTKNPEIKNQTTCDLFRNCQAQLLALNKRADAMHETEKRPALEQGKAIDERFRFRATVKVLTERLRQRFGAFMAVEERRQQEEARRKFEAERAAAEAERQRIEEQQAQLMQDDPIQALTSPPVELPEMPTAPEPVKVQAGGGFGRKSGLRTDWLGQIEDYQAALAHFSEHPDVRAAVEKLVKQTVKTSKGTAKIPGVKIVEERRAA